MTIHLVIQRKLTNADRLDMNTYKKLTSFGLILMFSCFVNADDHHHGHNRKHTYQGKNEYRPYGNSVTLDNGHFGYNPNDGTYGQPHKHNAKRGYGGYGNLINNAYGYGYQYGVLGRAEPKGYNKWNPYDILVSLNRHQLHYAH